MHHSTPHPPAQEGDDEAWADEDLEDEEDEDDPHAEVIGSGAAASSESNARAASWFDLQRNETVLSCHDTSIVTPERTLIGVVALTSVRRRPESDRRASSRGGKLGLFANAAASAHGLKDGQHVEHRLRFAPIHVARDDAHSADLGLELSIPGHAAVDEKKQLEARGGAI